jgi:YD repeat-containing protein
VQADGKLYVGTESGHVFILKPRGESVDVLSDVTLPVSLTGLYSAGTPEPVLASAAVAHGRVIFASADNLYCIGRKTPVTPAAKPAPLPPGEGAVAWVQVRPAEALLKPGQITTFHAFSYDAQGRLLREEKAAWSLEQLTGVIDGASFRAPAANSGQAGLMKATVGGVSGEARVRVAPVPEWTEDFEKMAPGAPPLNWISAAAGKFEVQDFEGSKVIVKLPNESLFKRMRVLFGPNDLHDYTMEADVRAPEKRRQQGDVGIFAQRYGLVLFGNAQRLELLPWQPETQRTVAVEFPWVKDTWYRIKLRAENLPDGKVRLLGKAWKRDEPEPAKWLIDKTDPVGNREGSPGLFGDAQFGVYYDNLKVTANR